MKKLAMKLDDLRVETLDMGVDAVSSRGTVAAHAPTVGQTCAATCYTCGVNPTTTETARAADPTFVNCPVCG